MKKKKIDIPILILNLLGANGYKLQVLRLSNYISKTHLIEESKTIDKLQYLNIRGFINIIEDNNFMSLSREKEKIDNIIEFYKDKGTSSHVIYCRAELTKEGIEELEKLKKPVAKEFKQNKGLEYISRKTINSIKKIKTSKFDFKKLTRLCEEINICYNDECYYSLMALLRAILDHIPPLFGFGIFKEVVSKYKGGKSLQQQISHLENSSRKIADSFLHTTIRNKESNPTKSQVNFGSDLETILLEIIRIYK